MFRETNKRGQSQHCAVMELSTQTAARASTGAHAANEQRTVAAGDVPATDTESEGRSVVLYAPWLAKSKLLTNQQAEDGPKIDTRNKGDVRIL